MTVAGLPVVTGAAQHRSKRERGEVWKHAGPAKNEKPRIVRNQMQAPKLHFRRPPDLAVTVPALEGTGLPPGRSNTQPAPCDDVAQAASGEAPESKAMVPVDRRILLETFMRPCKADLHIGKGDAVRQLGEERSVFQRWPMPR